MAPPLEKSFEWYRSESVHEDPALICRSRDLFQGRLDSMYRELSAQGRQEAELSLLCAVVGEVGNNSFDHNLGQWRDVPGCWFEFGADQEVVWATVADRGQGILSSLRRVLPGLRDDREALETAFARRVSGRSPEQRGNGLKFVRAVINGQASRGVVCTSGKGFISFGTLSETPRTTLEPRISGVGGRGTYTVILWGGL